MKMIKLNNKDKAERIIHSGIKSHKMQCRIQYKSDLNGDMKEEYLIFYEQR